MNLKLKHNAGKMRQNMSYAESYMWKLLRNRKLNRYKFRRQYIIPPYIVDYICLHKRLIIELDGHSHELQQEYDAKRTAYLTKQGYHLIRFTNANLLSQPDDVLSNILQTLEALV